jgi:hypothetical protein
MPVKDSAMRALPYSRPFRSKVADDDTVDLDEQIDLLEGDFQSRGDPVRRIAFAVHA